MPILTCILITFAVFRPIMRVSQWPRLLSVFHLLWLLFRVPPSNIAPSLACLFGELKKERLTLDFEVAGGRITSPYFDLAFKVTALTQAFFSADALHFKRSKLNQGKAVYWRSQVGLPHKTIQVLVSLWGSRVVHWLWAHLTLVWTLVPSGWT